MRVLLIFLMCACFLKPSGLLGQAFQVNLQGQKQTGMAGAGAALIQDETTLFFNPGGMSMIPRNAVGAGINPLWFKPAFTTAGSNTTERPANNVATPLAAYGVWGPEAARWKLGIGVYTPFGGLVDWGTTWSGRFSLTSLDLKAVFIQPTFSYQLTENWGIGAGFVYSHGSVNLQRMLPTPGMESHLTLKGTGNGYGWNAGIYYRAENGFAVSLAHRSKVVTKLEEGDAIFDVPDALRPGFPEGNTFSSELPLPGTTTLGFALPVSTTTSLAFDASLVYWSVYKELAFDFETNTPLLEDSRSERNYRNGGSLKLGVQHEVNEAFRLRAGTGYVFTPVRDGFVTPETPDANRLLFSAGAGYAFGRNWEVNASLLYQHILSREQTNRETGLAGTFRTQVWAPGLSVSYYW